jgi:hypothetical protein
MGQGREINHEEHEEHEEKQRWEFYLLTLRVLRALRGEMQLAHFSKLTLWDNRKHE